MAEPNRTDKSANAPILIKKYANRRLYHTQKSSYVTLDDLALMVKQGEDFVVQDAKTGEDITRNILTQIIFDAENSGQMLLPVSFLREIIRLYGDTMQSIVPGYLEQAMAIFSKSQTHYREEFEKSLAQNPAMIGMEGLANLNREWMERTMQMFGIFSKLEEGASHEDEEPQGDGAGEMAEGDSGGRDGEIEALRGELEEMQKTLARLSARGRD